MIARLGVSVQTGEVRAVLVRRGHIRWRASVEGAYSAATGKELLASLLASLPKAIGPRRATIAIGPAWCQVKQIDGLPPVSDLATLTRLLRENAASFFLRSGQRLAVSNVVRFDDGSHWAAAFDHDVALLAIESLRPFKFAKAVVVPGASAVASVLPTGVHRWTDGEHTLELANGDDGSLRYVRRVRADDESPLPALGKPLAELGSEGWAHAAAFGAAVSPRMAAFVWRPASDPKRLARARRVRVAAAVVLSIGTAVAAIGAPGARAVQIVRESSHEMNALRESQTEVARAQGELRRLAATLDRVERFREQRGKVTMLVGAISQVLPESTALVTLRLDSLEGNFVALTPHAADILAQLAEVTELSSPRIVGSLTKEMIGSAQLERATVRFKRAGAVSQEQRTSRR